MNDPIIITDEKINAFAVKQGYKSAKYIGDWKGYKVYEPINSNDGVSYTGLPLVILVNDKGEIRMSTSDEALATQNEDGFMESFNDNQVEVRKIIDEIKSNLTDDKDKNYKYLNEQLKKYSNHHLNSEINKEINRLLYDGLSDADKTEFNKSVEQDMDDVQKLLKDANECIRNKDFGKAKGLLSDYIDISTTANKEDELTVYYSFRDLIEFYCSNIKIKTNKKVVWTAFDISGAYKLLGFIANEEKEFDKAIEFLDKANHYNPIDPSIYFEKSETYKMQNDFEKMLEETKKAYDFIFDHFELARYYRNLGYYYTKKKQFDIAYFLYMVSLEFENNVSAYNEIIFIKHQVGNPNYIIQVDESMKLLEKENIPVGAKKENIDKLIQFTLEKEINEKQPNLIKTVNGILYNLTKDQQFSSVWEIVNEQYGFTYLVPKEWKMIKEEVIKRDFGKETVSVFLDETNNISMQLTVDGRCTPEQFEEAYKLNIENMKRSGITVLNEQTIKGMQHIKQAILEFNVNGKKIIMMQNFIIINDHLFNFGIPLDINISLSDFNAFMNQPNASKLMNVVFSILVKQPNNSPTKDDLKTISEKLDSETKANLGTMREYTVTENGIVDTEKDLTKPNEEEDTDFELKAQVIDNHFDYSNVVADTESILLLVNQFDIIFKKMQNIFDEDEKRNEQLKWEFKNYNYKNRYSKLEFNIRQKSFNTVTCDSYQALVEFINTGQLNNLSSFDIKMNINYSRGKSDNSINLDNDFIVTFKPYEIDFTRKSNYNELYMKQIEDSINGVLKQFKTINTIFNAK